MIERWIGERDALRMRTFLDKMGEHKLPWPLIGLFVGIALVVGALLAFLTPVGGIAVLIACGGALLMLRDVRWAFLALLSVICLLPFASLPFKIGFTPTFLDLAFAALYAVWFVRLITRRQDDFILTPLGLPILSFIALAVFCFLLGLAHARPSANDVRRFAEILMGLGIFFVVINNLRDESVLRQATAVLILIAAAEAAIGMVLYLVPRGWAVALLNPLGRLGYPVGPGALRFINDDPGRPMRAIGTNVDPNILGAMLVMAVAITSVQLFLRRPVLPRIWVFGAFGLLSLCLFLTYSRGSMVGAVAALVLVAALKYRRLLIVLILGALLLLLLPQTQAYVANFVQGIEIADRSTQMRMGEYKDAWRLIQRYPWIGVGFVSAPDIDLYLAVASLYLALAGQMGIIGLVVFLLVMAVFFLYVFRAWRVLPPGSALESLLLGYGAAVLGSLVGGVFDHTLLTYPHAVALLWFTLGMAAAAAYVGQRQLFTQNSRSDPVI
jgi:O-antigen ligase